MKLIIDLQYFSVLVTGFTCIANSLDNAGKTAPNKTLYTSPGLQISDIDALATSEYGQAICVDHSEREIQFGRDYLGHFPLLYLHTREYLIISDEIHEIISWCRTQGIKLTLSAQALALYFTTGYVPQGFTLYEEIVSCENASKYIYRNGRVIKEKLFEPVEVDQAVGLGDLRYSIEQEVAAIKSGHELIDVWCSGGLDSAIMVHCFNEGHQNPTGILTLGYDSKVRESFGDGELRFVQDLAAYYKVDFQRIDLTEARYNAAYQQMVSAHISPVVDIVAPPKYALASATREMAITGEGGDPLFSGVKNNMVLYALKKNSTLSFGEIYALAHQRLFHELGNVLEDGTNLIDFVIEYFNKQYSLFPGDTNRRLFYLNTFLKQGGMIFPKNYYAAKRNGIAVRHPLTALNVYRTAFSLSDDQKYIYPKGKLALISLYKDSLPKSVIERKKSGTRLPLDFYLNIIMKGNEGFDFLQNTGMFNAEYIGSIANKRESSPLLLYGLQVLNDWLIHNGGYQHATTNLPAEARNIQSPSISGGVQRASG